MNVYLAGKVDPKNGAWRNAILGMDYAYDSRKRERVSVPRWATETPYDDDWKSVVNRWTPRPGIVLGLHTYTGPYRQEIRPDVDWKHKGEFHGVTTWGMHGDFHTPGAEDHIATEAKAAIERSDLIFAYLNTPDAFGTLLEIGYAAALGKFVSLVIHEDAMWSPEDYWFVMRFASMPAAYVLNPRGDEWSPYEEFGSCDYARVGSDDEGFVLKNELKNAFVAYSAKPNPTALMPVNTDDRLLAEAAHSFMQILRWTSDPRVRDEAERMLRVLGVSPGLPRR
jgi:hypothetical protein